MSGRVIVVGSVNIDLVARVPRLPRPGETVTGGTFERHQGGKGGNQAVAVARLGRPTLIVGAVGDDTFATDARRALASERVDVSMLASLLGQPTGVALILVDSTGENEIAVAPGANVEIEAGAVRDALRRLGRLTGDIVMVSNEIPSRTVSETLTAAREAGARTIFNPAPALGIDRTVFSQADILTPNRTELATLIQAEGARRGTRRGDANEIAGAARALLHEPGVREGAREAVIVTLGASGAYVAARDDEAEAGTRTWEVPADRVASIDTTGAGDAFVGALAASLAAGGRLDEAVRRAVAAGALATTKVGAREGMPTLAELDAFLSR